MAEHKYIVEIEEGVWLDGSDGDPGRTTNWHNAKLFDTWGEADAARRAARLYRSFSGATIVPLCPADQQVIAERDRYSDQLEEIRALFDGPPEYKSRLNLLEKVQEIATRNPLCDTPLSLECHSLRGKLADAEAEVERLKECEKIVAQVESTFGCSRSRIVVVARDVMNRANDLARATSLLESGVKAIAEAAAKPPLEWARLEKQLADATADVDRLEAIVIAETLAKDCD
jgi:hypothetical protein